MTTHNERDRAISAWLAAEAPHRAPDDVLEASRDRIRSTRQRRPWWPAWRLMDMNNGLRIAIAAAAVLVVAVIGYQLLPGNTGSVGAQPTATPQATATPEPTEVPLMPEEGPLEAGTYRMDTGPTFVLTVPAGWVSTGSGVRKHLEGPNEVALHVWSTDIQVFADACQSEGTEEPVGPTAADLLAALRAQENSEISNPVDATVGGLTGMRLAISAPAGLDVSECSIGSLQIWVAGEDYLAGMTPDTPPATVYIADTPGGRLIYGTGHEPAATAADIAELDAIVASIEVVE